MMKVPELKEKIINLFDYSYMCQEYVLEWEFPVSKKVLIDFLIDTYAAVKEYQKSSDDKEECELLLGEIARFLYNVDAEGFKETAVSHFANAAQMQPGDYRTVWFLGFFLYQSGKVILGIEYMRQVYDTVPHDQIVALFWDEFYVVCLTAQMPATAFYARKMALKLKAKSDYLHYSATDAAKKLAKESLPYDPKSGMDPTTLWRVRKEGKYSVVFNYSFGFRLIVNSDDRVQSMNTAKYVSYVSFFIPTIEAKGFSINASIAVLSLIGDEAGGEKDMVETMKKKFNDLKQVKADWPIPEGSRLYSGTDAKMYPESGGARFLMICLERDYPELPGVRLEDPAMFPKGENPVSFYEVQPLIQRCRDKITYIIMLDTAEWAYAEALEVFKDFVENRLVID
jgi:hypothetical protein